MFQIQVETGAYVPGLNPTLGKCLYGNIMELLKLLVSNKAYELTYVVVIANL